MTRRLTSDLVASYEVPLASGGELEVTRNHAGAWIVFRGDHVLLKNGWRDMFTMHGNMSDQFATFTDPQDALDAAVAAGADVCENP